MKKLASVLEMMFSLLAQAQSIAVLGFLSVLFHVPLTRQGLMHLVQLSRP
jgi:hypothetical protein